MDVLSNIDLHLIYLLVFSIALAFGVGVSFLSTALSVAVARDARLSGDELRIMQTAKWVAWLSFLLYSISGVGLFTLSYEVMIGLDIFWASQTIISVLFIMMLVLYFVLLPRLTTVLDTEAKTGRIFAYITISELIVFISWVFLMVHHVMYRMPFEYTQFLALYTGTVCIGVCVLAFVTRRWEATDVKKPFILTFIIFGTLSITLALLSIFVEQQSSIQKTATKQDTRTELTNSQRTLYRPETIAQHNTVEDCWVIIESEVYDATSAAAHFPEIYECGADVTEAYRTVVPEGVSERMQAYHLGGVGYTQEMISSNHHKDSCLLIIDDLVFDATAESKLHPAAFNCGSDASENYHKNHGDDISDTMMQYHVGYLLDDGTSSADDTQVTHAVIEPYRELYVDEGDWNNADLMAVVEKDTEKLLFIDGQTHTPIGRVHDVGYQPHTSVFSPNAQFMYIIARDGWLTKIDLSTLEPERTVRVGINSRGTALTENGKYLAIGNYEPGNVVILDAETLETLADIPTTGTLDGKQIESRVGAVVEDGNMIIIALKDLNSVWTIKTESGDIAVVEKYWDIGDNETPLHDAYLTPDGRFYIVASMGSNTVWVLDTDTWEPIGEIRTGETPHTGPGATWKNYTYVPALGEGLITVINTDSWEPEAYIETGGPGLFVRSFSEDPSYPYIWTETAFGEHQDEIYVIDARTNEILETIIPVEGESSWHPEFTNDGAFVYVVSQSGNQIVIYDAYSFAEVARIDAETPSAVSNVGNRIEEKGL